MVLDMFESLLDELAKALEIEKLTPDENNSCIIKFENELEIQIEPLDTGSFLFINVDLGEMPPGRYREEVFREALKANGMETPRHGTFCYSDQSDHLMLYKLIPLQDITGERVAAFLTPFMEKAVKWKETLENNEVPVVDTMHTSGVPGGGMFGM